ncbi:unnamed protein product [Rotaria sordida]|uniref:Uncharacterized protein n=2 Tax=Rotaria sordida TaxID=392033 RepID=A0A814DME8_9BILA|nr:unnamed protein product [Rotaria sordida]
MLLKAQLVSVLLYALVLTANAHMAAWSRGMYCMKGRGGENNMNNNLPVNPLVDLTQKDWWFQHYQGCDKEPPPAGDYLELPAGGSFTVEIATNRAFTTFGHNRNFNGYFGGPQELEYTPWGCVSYPNLHTPNQDSAPGTVFAISYQNSIDKVTPENLVVFTVRYKTPWQRVTSYDVPKDLPPCPPGGCTCAWGWIPMGCGQPNMYMQGHKCIVTGSTSTKKLAVAKPPVYCENDRSKCVKGAKQMIFYFQKDGNNVFNVPKMPTYNEVMGFSEGAQNDIFEDSNLVSTVGNVLLNSYVNLPSNCYSVSNLPTNTEWTLVTNVYSPVASNAMIVESREELKSISTDSITTETSSQITSSDKSPINGTDMKTEFDNSPKKTI